MIRRRISAEWQGVSARTPVCSVLSRWRSRLSNLDSLRRRLKDSDLSGMVGPDFRQVNEDPGVDGVLKGR